jgi:peptidoglycan endopeptidase LytE
MAGQYASGSHPGRDQLRRGDLVFFQNTYTPGLSHDGVYVGDDRFVSAVDERHGVALSSLDGPYWLEHFFGVTRPRVQ